MNVHVMRCALQWAALAAFVSACSHPAPARAPIATEKIDTSTTSGSYAETPPLALHSQIPATSSANDLDNSGPKVAEPPQQKAKTEPKLSDPEDYVPLSKHSSVPVGGNVHGHER